MTYVHRITFGQQYRTQAHPRVTFAHPDGWLEIEVVGINREGDAMVIAREFAFDSLGHHWAFDYTPDEWERQNPDESRARWYPLGVLARATLDAAGHVSWKVFHEFTQTMAEVTSADPVGDGIDGVDIRRRP